MDDYLEGYRDGRLWEWFGRDFQEWKRMNGELKETGNIRWPSASIN